MMDGMRISRIVSATSTLALAAALTTGCGDDQAATSIAVISPAPGAQVTVPFEVVLETSVPLGPSNQEDRHHAHIWFGDDQDTFLVVESTTQMITNAPAGEHVMHVTLHLADHTPTGAEASVTLIIANPGTADR
jgi:hypothetical protein